MANSPGVPHPRRPGIAMTSALRGFVVFGVILSGYVVALIWIPAAVGPEPGVASAAALEGYSNPAAYHAALWWSLIAMLGLAVLSARWTPQWTPIEPARADNLSSRPFVASPPADPVRVLARPGTAALVVGLLCFLAYLPPILARSGPFVEDSLMLSVLHRMDAGQVPYTDFEFLYGPLLIYPAHWWMQLFKYSMGSYYTFYSITQALGFGVLTWVLLRLWAGHPGKGWLALLVLSPFFLDTLLGINWFGVRRMIPLFLLVAAARDTERPRNLLGLGVGAGLLLAYSHDYGVGALLALATLFAAVALSERSVGALVRGALVGGIAVAVWGTTTVALLGPAWGDYIQTTRELVGRFSLGEAGFTFYWTVGSVALFALLSVAVARTGTALAHLRSWRLSSGDRLLLLSLVYALVLLKAGLNRADVFHITPPFLGLALAIVLPLPRSVFRLHSRHRAFAVGLVVVASLCTLVGNLPGGSYLAQGELAGLRALLSGAERGPDPETRSRTVTIMTDQIEPDEPSQQLASFLSAPANRDRPVYFYGRLYALDKILGVEKRQYMNDDFMYSDERGYGERAFLEAHRNALVLISEGQWRRVQDPASGDPAEEYAAFLQPTVTKRLVSVLSSVHFRGIPAELTAREERWTRTVGQHLLTAGYRSIAQFDDVQVLARSPFSVPPPE